MRSRHVLSSFFSICFFISGTVLAAEQYAGDWVMESMTLSVTVKSWGTHCGRRPESYRSTKTRPVKIVARGNHLVFSEGGIRTDRCGSPNPRLYTVSQNAAPGKWHRVCQTEKSDPKFERGRYHLSAQGSSRLNYTASSNFDWHLKGDHCAAFSEEKRVYVRARPASPGAAAPTRSAKPLKSDDSSESRCQQTGALKRLRVTPRRTRIGPGEKHCFKAFGVDEKGCRSPLEASWAASQNGKPVPGRISRKGCFRAGKTAADADGRYRVTATFGDLSGSAELTVVFPDLGELLSARLTPVEESDATEPQPALAPNNGSPPAAPRKSPPNPAEPVAPAQIPRSDGGSDKAPVVAIAAAMLAVAVLLFAIVRRRLFKPGRGRSQTCPTCGAKLPIDAVFCPHDRTSLAPEDSAADDASRLSGSLSDAGMVCPRCHRGYDGESRFCPHDSEPLVSYEEWREQYRS